MYYITTDTTTSTLKGVHFNNNLTDLSDLELDDNISATEITKEEYEEKMKNPIPKKALTLAEIKTNKIKKLKNEAHNILLDTDWYFIRKFETEKNISQTILDYRKSMRDYTEQAENDINNLKSKDEVKKYKIDFSIQKKK